MQDIIGQRQAALGSGDARVAEVHVTAALALSELGEAERAQQQLQAARSIMQQQQGQQAITAAAGAPSSQPPQQQLGRVLEAAEAHVAAGTGGGSSTGRCRLPSPLLASR